MTLLRGLELEHAVPRAQFEIQGQGREQVLEGLIRFASVAKVTDADSHADQIGAWSGV
jgi:hypothetical protein